MKKFYALVVLVSAFILANFVMAGALEFVTPEQAYKLQSDSKAVIIDVREPDELVSGKILGALTIPLSVMNNDRENWDKKINEFKKDQTILVYCRSGRRSELVGSEMVKKGLKVYNLGGFDAWKAKSLPTE